jgi:hypothetical protein
MGFTPRGFVSTANSTSANLGANAIFTGTSEDVSQFSSIAISVFSSHASATDGLSLQQSSDGSNWDITDVYTISAAAGKTINIQVTAKFYRVVYTNGGTLTTSLRIQSIYHTSTKKGSSVRPQDARSNENDMEEDLSYLMIYNTATWDRARGDTTNGLDVDVTRVSGNVTVVQSTASSLNTTEASAASSLTSLQLIDDVIITDNAQFTDGTTKLAMNGYIFDETAGTALTENDAAAARINVNRAVISVLEDSTTRGRYATVTASNALKVDASGVAVPVTDNSGSLTVDAPVGTPLFTTPTPSTTGGWSAYNATTGDGSTGLTSTAQSIKTSQGTLGGWYIFNPNSITTWVIIYNVTQASVTVGTTNPAMVLAIPAGSAANLEMTNGIQFGTAISVAATSTAAGNAAPTSALDAMFWYK